MELTPVVQKFILHWGEMGTRWGINRTVAQIHALLYISPHPLHAEDIAQTLSVARSNVSTSLRELQGWGIVKVVHVLGDRRDHFECMGDVWDMFHVIIEERKRREIDPTLVVLRECVQEARSAGPSEAHSRERLEKLLDFMATVTGWYDKVRGMPVGAFKKFLKMGDKLAGFLGLTGKKR